jgi:hypothetical protein
MGAVLLKTEEISFENFSESSHDFPYRIIGVLPVYKLKSLLLVDMLLFRESIIVISYKKKCVISKLNVLNLSTSDSHCPASTFHCGVTQTKALVQKG